MPRESIRFSLKPSAPIDDLNGSYDITGWCVASVRDINDYERTADRTMIPSDSPSGYALQSGPRTSTRRMSFFGKDDRGSTLIELAVTLPILALIFAGLVNYSMYIIKAIQVQEAAAAGAAYGTIPGNAADVNGMQTAARNASPAISNMSVTASTIYMCTSGGSLVTSSASCSTNKTPMRYVRVTTSVSASPVFLFRSLSPQQQLSGTATMRVPWGP